MQEAGSAGREAQCCPPTVVLGVHRVLESEGFGDLNISNSTREWLWSHFQYLGYASKTHQKSLETKSLQAKLKKTVVDQKKGFLIKPRGSALPPGNPHLPGKSSELPACDIDCFACAAADFSLEDTGGRGVKDIVSWGLLCVYIYIY